MTEQVDYDPFEDGTSVEVGKRKVGGDSWERWRMRWLVQKPQPVQPPRILPVRRNEPAPPALKVSRELELHRAACRRMDEAKEQANRQTLALERALDAALDAAIALDREAPWLAEPPPTDNL